MAAKDEIEFGLKGAADELRRGVAFLSHASLHAPPGSEASTAICTWLAQAKALYEQTSRDFALDLAPSGGLTSYERAAIEAGNPIDAIRSYRSRTGCGLK